MSSHVGPIVFSDETARSQLVDEGVAVTFRASERTTGSTWWRESRTGEKRGDVEVERIEAVDPSDDEALTPYRELSGFDTVEAWREAIRELNGGDVESGVLYRATLPEHEVATDGGERADLDDVETTTIHGNEYPVPGGWVLGAVDADGAIWRFYPRIAEPESERVRDLDVDEALPSPVMSAHITNDVIEDGSGFSSELVPTVSFEVGDRELFAVEDPEWREVIEVVAETLDDLAGGVGLDAIEADVGSGRPLRLDDEDDDVAERRREENRSLGDYL